MIYSSTYLSRLQLHLHITFPNGHNAVLHIHVAIVVVMRHAVFLYHVHVSVHHHLALSPLKHHCFLVEKTNLPLPATFQGLLRRNHFCTVKMVSNTVEPPVSSRFLCDHQVHVPWHPVWTLITFAFKHLHRVSGCSRRKVHVVVSLFPFCSLATTGFAWFGNGGTLSATLVARRLELLDHRAHLAPRQNDTAASTPRTSVSLAVGAAAARTALAHIVHFDVEAKVSADIKVPQRHQQAHLCVWAASLALAVVVVVAMLEELVEKIAKIEVGASAALVWIGVAKTVIVQFLLCVAQNLVRLSYLNEPVMCFWIGVLVWMVLFGQSAVCRLDGFFVGIFGDVKHLVRV